MIEINCKRLNRSFELTIKGHAGYAPIGEDIVCAGVSALYYALRERAFDYREDSGDIWLTGRGNKAMDALDVVMGGFKLLEQSYKGYVRVTDG